MQFVLNRIFAEGSYNGVILPFIVKAGVASDYGDRFQYRYGDTLVLNSTFNLNSDHASADSKTKLVQMEGKKKSSNRRIFHGTR